MSAKLPTGKPDSEGAAFLSGSRGKLLHIHVPRAVVFGLCMAALLLVAGAGGLGFWVGRNGERVLGQGLTKEAAYSPERPGAPAPSPRTRTGSWGEIQSQRSVMEMPPEHLPVRNYESRPLNWFFGGFTPATLSQLLTNCQCSTKEISALLRAVSEREQPRGVSVQVPDSIVLSLSAESRKELYAVLARFPENEAQRDPFHWPADDEASLFANSQVAPDTRALFQRLSYRRGKSVLFADLSVLLRNLRDPAQHTAIVKVLTRRSVVFASLKISPKSDIRALLSYWGTGGNARDILPVLQAAASLPEGRDLSVAALMPPAPRALLFTFPLPGGGAQPNCHWTAFNFFKENPDPPTTDDRFWLNKLKAEYGPVEGEPRYGDVLVLQRPDGDLLHTCVFLADDIVYTKNGISHWAPWQLMTISDLLEYYSWDLAPGQTLKCLFFRQHSLEQRLSSR